MTGKDKNTEKTDKSKDNLDQDLGLGLADFLSYGDVGAEDTAPVEDTGNENGADFLSMDSIFPKDETPAEGEAPTDGEPPAEGQAPTEGQAPADGDRTAEGQPTEEEVSKEMDAQKAAENKPTVTVQQETIEELTQDGTPEKKDGAEVVDDAIQLIDELTRMIDNSEGSDAEIKDKMGDIKETTDKVDEATNVADYKSLLDEYSTKFDELSDLIMEKENDNESKTMEITRLKRLLEDMTQQVDDNEFKGLRNKAVMNVLDNHDDLRPFIRLYGAYVDGNEKVKPSLIDELSNISKELLGIDIKSLLADKAQEEKNKVTEDDYAEETPMAVKVNSKGNEDFLPGL